MGFLDPFFIESLIYKDKYDMIIIGEVMKRIYSLLLIVLTLFGLSSCFLFGKNTTYPDMVEYGRQEVLDVAKEKYSIKKWLFNTSYINGETTYDENNNLVINIYGDYITQFNSNFINGDNIDKAFTSFAGKNGGHDIQGKYRYFLCYVALGELEDGSLKYVYYNTNINKGVEIKDTIGSSDYNFDIHPEEIDKDLFKVDPLWGDMSIYLRYFENISPKALIYAQDKLKVYRREKYNALTEIEFYLEDDKVVFDMNYILDERHLEDKQLVFSTSKQYGYIYYYYGVDVSSYFDVYHLVEQSKENDNQVILKEYVKLKDLDGVILYSMIETRTEYKVIYDNDVLMRQEVDTFIGNINIEKEYLIDKINGVDFQETSKFKVSDFYVFYKKN